MSLLHKRINNPVEPLKLRGKRLAIPMNPEMESALDWLEHGAHTLVSVIEQIRIHPKNVDNLIDNAILIINDVTTHAHRIKAALKSGGT